MDGRALDRLNVLAINDDRRAFEIDLGTVVRANQGVDGFFQVIQALGTQKSDLDCH
jgi:hypothetical protein